jgi:hypothetical protein
MLNLSKQKIKIAEKVYKYVEAHIKKITHKISSYDEKSKKQG